MVSKKIKELKDLIKIISELRVRGKRIISTNGVFDILHIGHIRYLQEAKSMGDFLIVAVNSDSSVNKIKGPKRPINNENDRIEALAALECVDYVIIFSEKDPRALLEYIKPDIHVKADDYKIDQIIEKSTVEKNGGKVVLASKVEGYSTTTLIDKILELR
jgi:D-glycero-beta-D-manno-heptose 1-phosphate adenylyltransferase